MNRITTVASILVSKVVLKISLFVLSLGILVAPTTSCGGINGEGAEAEPGTIPTLDGVISSKEYQQHKSFNSDYDIYWSTYEGFIYIGLKAKTYGWVAIGFQPDNDNKKEGVDFILGYKTQQSEQVFDMFSENEGGPHPLDGDLDGTDDIMAFATSETDGFMVIEFKRKLDTGDMYDRVLLHGIQKIIWAYSADDGLYSEHNNGAWGYSSIDIKINN